MDTDTTVTGTGTTVVDTGVDTNNVAMDSSFSKAPIKAISSRL